MVYYAVADISQLNDDEAESLRKKIGKHFLKKETLKRKESVAAKAILCKLLESRFGITDFVVDCNENGKPFILGEKLCFNLSHSGNYAMCAVGDEATGCDVQQITEYNQRVAKRFFTLVESEQLESDSDKARGFTRMWTLKESALKLSGEGVSGGLDRYDFSGYYNKSSFKLKGLCFNVFELSDYVVSICSEKGCISQVAVDIKSFELKGD